MLLLGSIANAETPTPFKGFDTNQFPASEYSVSYDDMENRYFIDSTRSWADTFKFSHSDSNSNYFSVIWPDVFVYNVGKEDENSIFRIWMLYNANEWLFIDNAIIKCGDTRFTVDDIDIDTEVMDHGAVNEKLLIRVGSFDKDFMEAWIKADKITIRLKGDNGYRDFTVPDTAKKYIENMYTQFKLAENGSWSSLDYIK